MAASLNKVQIIGNLTKDVELRELAGGNFVASMSLATNEKYKDKAGEWVERAEYHNVTLWGKTAQLADQYLSKGASCYVEGRLTTEKYQKDGHDVYATKITADKLLFLGSKGGGKSDSSQGAKPQDTGNSYQEPVFNPDDEIPF